MESGNSVVFMHVCCTLVVAWQHLYKGPYTSSTDGRGDHEIALAVVTR